MSQIAHRYAKALFSMGTREDQEILHNELGQFRTWVFGSTELRSLLKNPLTPPPLQKNVVLALLKKANASKILQQAFSYLIDQRRFHLIDEIMREFKTLYRASAQIQQATITTATPLSPEDAHHFEAFVKERFTKKTEVSFVVDQSILGGVKIAVGPYLMDASVHHKLVNLQRTLKGA